MGFLELLSLLLVAAKLFGYLSWSWLWVFSPLWIGYGLFLVGFGIVALITVLAAYWSNK